MYRRAHPSGLQRVVRALMLCLACALGLACTPKERPVVVVYTSVDQVYSEPILRAFEEETGIQVRAVYDLEAAKTTGLVNRLIAERGAPQADVFWNGEFAQTLRLKREGVLAPYKPKAGMGIPPVYRDSEGYWVAFAGRARVLLVNTERVAIESSPQKLIDLLDADIPAERIGLAYPMFGTTATHAAALYATWGAERARDFFQRLEARGVRIVDGNSVVRDLVVKGELWAGLTDTDDACGAVERGAPVALVFLDQAEGELGTLVIPNTAAVIANAPHPENARRLIDYLLRPDVQQRLIEMGWSHVSLADGTFRGCAEPRALRTMAVSLEAIDAQMARAQAELREVFVR